MLTICCWQWTGTNLGDRPYTPAQVTTLARSVKRVLSIPHRFVCVSDETGFGPEVEVVETPAAAQALAALRSPEGGRFPSCYRRLWSFSAEAREVLGERLFVTDIDWVPVRDFAHLFARSEDFVGWRPRAVWGTSQRIAGGQYLLRAGTLTDVYTDFKGAASIAAARQAGFRGSDQAWMSYKLNGRAALWPGNAGIYSIRDLRNGLLPLPGDAAIVHFNGSCKQWDVRHQRLPWVREHWR